MNKFLPEYLEELSKASAASAEALKEVCKKLDLILDAVYGEEETDVTETEISNNEDKTDTETEVSADNKEEPIKEENADDKQTQEPKKRGRKPKK